MTTPIVLVDIDGVLNAFGAPNPFASNFRVRRAGGYRVVLDTRHPEWIAEMAEHAQMKWATMWQADAPTVFAPIIGFGQDWDFIPFDDLADEAEYVGRIGEGVVGYKWAGILAEAASGRPLVYLDDDMSPEHHRWAERRNHTVPTLFIQPDPSEGITEAQYERVMDFLSLHSEVAA